MRMMLINFFRKFFSIVFVFVTLIVNNADTPQKEEFIEPVETETFILMDALMHGQGITTDGEYYYFSSICGLIKTKLDGGTRVAQNTVAIPLELMLKGCDHIGGISYMNGYVYASVEDSKVFQNLYLIKYDAKTLKAVQYQAMPTEKHPQGAPWCVADKENNVIYSARQDHFEELNVYDADTLEYLYSMPVSGQPHKIQGGEIYNGVLYCSASRQNGAVFAINLKTGEGKLIMERALNDDAEGEGMTIVTDESGVYFVMLDVATVRLGVNMRKYAFDPDSIEWTK